MQNFNRKKIKFWNQRLAHFFKVSSCQFCWGYSQIILNNELNGTEGATAFNLMAPGITTLSVFTFRMTVIKGSDTGHNDTRRNTNKCSVEFYNIAIKRSDVMLSVILVNEVCLHVIDWLS